MKVTLNGPVEHHAEMLWVAHDFASTNTGRRSGQWFGTVYLNPDRSAGDYAVHWTAARAVVVTHFLPKGVG